MKTTMADDGVFHDEIEIEDFEFDSENETFTYPCPCGDLFTITKEELLNGEEIARCPSCSLVIRVIYNADELEKLIDVKTTQTSASLAVN